MSLKVSQHLVQDSSDGASGWQERRAGPPSEIPPEPADGYPADPAPQRGNHDNLNNMPHPALEYLFFIQDIY